MTKTSNNLAVGLPSGGAARERAMMNSSVATATLGTHRRPPLRMITLNASRTSSATATAIGRPVETNKLGAKTPRRIKYAEICSAGNERKFRGGGIDQVVIEARCSRTLQVTVATSSACQAFFQAGLAMCSYQPTSRYVSRG